LFGRGGFSFLLAFGGISVSSFVFHIIISRLLGPSQYGITSALLSIIGLLMVPIGAVQIAITQAVIRQEARGQRFSILQVTKRSIVGGIFAMLVIGGLAPVTDKFLHISSPLPVYLVALWIPLATISAVLQGALIGEYRFRPVAFASFMGVGLVRLALGAVMVVAGFGVSGAVAATVIAQAFTLGSLLFSTRHELIQSGDTPVVRTKFHDTILSISALAGYTSLIGIDTLLARHFLAPALAGNYASGAVAAHIAFFVPAALVAVMFPHLADDENESGSSNKIFRQALTLTLVFGLLAAAGMTTFPGLAISILFGAKYSGAAGILGILSFASVAIGLLILFVYLHLARRSILALTPWVGVILSAVLIWLNHHSMTSVANIMLTVSFITMALAGAPVLFHLPSNKGSVGSE
jgi:O-antigen/teichoic acid export membrane protein